jgi:hypothetical protein
MMGWLMEKIGLSWESRGSSFAGYPGYQGYRVPRLSRISLVPLRDLIPWISLIPFRLDALDAIGVHIEVST